MRALESEVVLFNRKFDDAAVTFVFEKFRELEEAGETQVVLMINSPGGQVSALKSILDIIQSTEMHVITVVSGMAASCGLLLAMAGDTRLAYASATFMSHEFSSGSAGKAHELLADRKIQDQTARFFIDHYQLHTGLSKEKIASELLTPSDVWLNAEEAYALNLIDGIMDVGVKPIGVKAKNKVRKKMESEQVKAAEEFLKHRGSTTSPNGV